MKKAIILLSGGLDSATCLAIAKSKAYECYALSFRYGQKHSSELEAAKKLALAAQVKMHKTIDLDLGGFGGSALTDVEIDVPTYKAYDSVKQDSTELEASESDATEQENHIPVTYVPARNTVFLSIALAWAEVLQADIIMAGVNAVDYSGYPDCRPEYIEAFQKMADLATKAGIEGKGVKLDVPLINMSKVEIIRKGYSLGVDYSQTISCYQADESGAACGVCDSCIIRKEAFQNAIQKDPTKYN